MPEGLTEQAEAMKASILERRNQYRERAAVDARAIAEPQAAKYETIVYRLMNRVGGNMELVNAMNRFIDSLDHASSMGREEEPFSPQQIEGLTRFFAQQSETVNTNLQTLSDLGKE